MGIVDSAKQWLFSIAVKKGLKRGVQVAVALLVSKGIVTKAQTYGVTIDPDQLLAAGTVALTGAFESFRNYLKVKKGLSWL